MPPLGVVGWWGNGGRGRGANNNPTKEDTGEVAVHRTWTSSCPQDCYVLVRRKRKRTQRDERRTLGCAGRGVAKENGPSCCCGDYSVVGEGLSEEAVFEVRPQEQGAIWAQVGMKVVWASVQHLPRPRHGEEGRGRHQDCP